jgi:hypothetical protein
VVGAVGGLVAIVALLVSAFAGGGKQALVAGFASFANDLAANDATKVFNDLNVINQVCAVVRGPRTLNLHRQP